MKRIAVITARGGSKRLERKNIRPFHGRPIIHYAIDAARQSRLFDDVVVSTDDQEIATVAHLAGVHWVIKRPAELADDHATTGQAMRHAAEMVRAAHPEIEHIACIYPCTPLMIPADLHAGFDKLLTSGKSYVLSVAQYSPSIHRALMLWNDGAIRPVWSNLMNTRTQDLDKRYHDAGQWYIGKAEAWLKEVPILDSWSIGHEIPTWRAIDIDTYEDWVIAEAVYQAKFTNEGRPKP